MDVQSLLGTQRFDELCCFQSTIVYTRPESGKLTPCLGGIISHRTRTKDQTYRESPTPGQGSAGTTLVLISATGRGILTLN